MSNFEPYENGVKVFLTKRFIDCLTDHRIFSHQNIGVQRWKVGDSMCFLRKTEMEPYSAIYRGEFMNSLGAFSFITNPVIGTYQMQLSMGRLCSIGGGLRIVGNAHPITTLSSSPIMYEKERSWIHAFNLDHDVQDGPFVTRKPAKGVPVLGNDVWFGSDVTLNQAVEIGNGAVVAANAHVTRNVPPYAIVGGNPAQLIRYRFPYEIIQELEDIKPWQYSMKDLRHFDLQEITNFIKQFRAAEISLTPWRPPTANLWRLWCEVS